ncbi:hypothetical protein [Bacillus toyonensis]|uniref:hypothetical protein n=1 Tax=Bacillus toyonensis TaxID=155322 RepID=UPI00030F97FA|nr:hypothetical protein [Bacillus toyonensis]MBF7149745.1 hypothetical protein [Bacillus toyonensis]MBJ7949527.1 hypothetical protein [Bacillus cereus group sp. N24]MED3187905.1 hypothetical protein [Bacillus toyonensis]
MERNHFCLSEFSSNILSIHEQFSLLLQEKTIVIAEELGMKHLADPIERESWECRCIN